MSSVEAKGVTGVVVFDGSAVVIRRTGFLGRASVGKGEKRIPLASITAVQWKEPTALVNGFIQFTIHGGVERRSAFGSQTQDAARDENSVVMTKKQAPAFVALRTAIESAIAGPSAAAAAGPAVHSGATELERLAELHRRGVLTDAEFAAAKARVLGL